jgi:hypothetical protein
MKTRNRIVGLAGLTLAFVAMLSATGCDPYQQPNKDAPVVVGVIMIDVNGNGAPPDNAVCIVPYPQPDIAWAKQAFPGLCDPGNANVAINVCPVGCYPPRTGPAFAPFYVGNLGGTYATAGGGTYTYQLPALPGTYLLDNVPPAIILDANTTYDYSKIKVIFNKMMAPQSIETAPFSGVAPVTLQIYELGVVAPVTSEFTITYNPSNETKYWGAALEATRALGLKANTTYTIVGTVSDQNGNALDLNIVIRTGAILDFTAVP